MGKNRRRKRKKARGKHNGDKKDSYDDKVTTTNVYYQNNEKSALPSTTTTNANYNQNQRQSWPNTTNTNANYKQNVKSAQPRTTNTNANYRQNVKSVQPSTTNTNANYNQNVKSAQPSTTTTNDNYNKNQRQTWPNTTTTNANYNKNQRQDWPDNSTPNVYFYQNEIPAWPNKEHIEEIMLAWTGNYEKLERNHSYIQWFFPNRVPGVNPHASILTDEEAKRKSSDAGNSDMPKNNRKVLPLSEMVNVLEKNHMLRLLRSTIIRSTPELRERVKQAFKMMLDFYGMRLTTDNQFELAENSKERLKELNTRRNHNFLRISRILLALKELGHGNLMLPWLKFLADLIYKEKKLENAKDSFQRFWIKTLDAEEDIQLKDYLQRNLFSTR